MMTDGNANRTGAGLPPGTKIGKYEVVEKVGAGGQSVVYKCYDPPLDRYVAAKQVSAHLADNPGFVERFRREARVLAKLGGEQQGIVTIHDLLEDDNGLFIVMEYVEGRTLEQVLASTGEPMATKPAAQLMWRIASAMSAVHKAGIVHRDLKPSNVIVGEDLRPTITDFGVAASLSGQTSMLMGTTKYMAPELFDGGEVDGRTDMYSLGFIMYELLLGRERFNEIFAEITRDPRTSAVRWMKWHGNESVSAPALHVVNPAIPGQLSSIIAKMMAKDADQRYAGMEALGVAIKKGLAGVPLSDEVTVSPVARPDLTTTEAIGPLGPEEAQPTLEELEESPTMALPKRTMTKRQRITIAIVAGAAIVLMGVGLGLYMHIQRSSAAKQAADVFAQGEEAYDAGNFSAAAELFERVRDQFPQTKEGAKCTVWAPLARAREALANQDAQTGFRMEQQAEDRLDELARRYGSDATSWVESRRNDIRAVREERQQQQSFRDFFDIVQRLADADRLTDALTELERRVPPGLNDQQAAQVRQFTQELNRRIVVAEQGRLAPLVLDAARYYRTAEADGLLIELEQLAASDRAKKYVPSETLKQWTDWVLTYRGIVTEISQVNSLEDRLDQAARAQNRIAELQITRALLAARRALAERFPPDKNAERISALEIDEVRLVDSEVEYIYQQGTVLLGEGFSHLAAGRTTEARTSFDQAMAKFAQCQDHTDNDHSPSKAAIGRLSAVGDWLARLDAANGLFVRGQWADARSAYSVLLDQHDYAWVQAKVTACSFNILIDEAKALMAEGRYDEALEKFDEASLLCPERYDTDIAPYVATIKRLQARSAKIADGLDLMAREKWADARDALQEARGSSATDAEIAEVDELLKDVEYGKYVDLGRRAQRHGQLKGAQTLYLLAREIRQTDEVDELLNEVARKIAEQEEG